MRDILGPGTTLGYCTNVHAGNTLEEIKDNLERYAVRVREQVCPDQPLDIGLWLPASAAIELRETAIMEGAEAAQRFHAWLGHNHLHVFTVNGFPYGDFHQRVVKHDVYEPDWQSELRAGYTADLALILAELLPPNGHGSISTLPVAWSSAVVDEEQASWNLRTTARLMEKIENKSGAMIHVDLEPEPGCRLDRCEDVIRFFDRYLDDESERRYLRVCHDVCHTAVMGEDQATVLDRYRQAGIKVGKVQISSAVRVNFDALDPADRLEALRQLRAFGEDRYLHQTMVTGADGSQTFYDDLPQAIAAAEAAGAAGEWRVHYHVPIYLERFGLLETTQNDIHRCLAAIGDDEVKHFEVETYAWDVLPDELKTSDLADGIARELQWLMAQRGTRRGG